MYRISYKNQKIFQAEESNQITHGAFSPDGIIKIKVCDIIILFQQNYLFISSIMDHQRLLRLKMENYCSI